MDPTIKNIFAPESIAIIGASSKIGSIGNSVVQNLIDSKYAVFFYFHLSSFIFCFYLYLLFLFLFFTLFFIKIF